MLIIQPLITLLFPLVEAGSPLLFTHLQAAWAPAGVWASQHSDSLSVSFYRPVYQCSCVAAPELAQPLAL